MNQQLRDQPQTKLPGTTAEHLKTAFLHNMTDQMAQPVSVIASIASIINEEYRYFSKGELTLFVDKMLANTGAITRLLKDLIDLTERDGGGHTSEEEQKKTAFIQDLTHQIRTPLNIIGGFAQVLRDDYEQLSADELSDITGAMQQNSVTITRIVGMLTTASRLEASKDILLGDCIGCNYLCREAAGEVRLMHPDRVGLHIQTTVPDALRIRTDKNSVLSVLQELLLNANKFTAEGNIILAVEAMPGGRVAFSVSDTGPGISEADSQRVFNHFTKLDSFSEGLGLGLTVSRQIAHMLGGTLTLDTTYRAATANGSQKGVHLQGRGARFVLTLPLNT